MAKFAASPMPASPAVKKATISFVESAAPIMAPSIKVRRQRNPMSAPPEKSPCYLNAAKMFPFQAAFG